MTKRISFLIAVVAAAILFSSAAFAAEPTSVSEETFLATLQAPSTDEAPAAPAEPNLGNEPKPIYMALPSCTPSCPCSYQCKKCTTTSVKLCAINCNGTNGCEACHSGTTCDF